MIDLTQVQVVGDFAPRGSSREVKLERALKKCENLIAVAELMSLWVIQLRIDGVIPYIVVHTAAQYKPLLNQRFLGEISEAPSHEADGCPRYLADFDPTPFGVKKLESDELGPRSHLGWTLLV